MSRAQTVLIIMTVGKFKHFRPVYIPTARFLPDFGRLYNRHHDFLGAGRIHFMTDNIFDFKNDPSAQRQEGIEPGGAFPDHAGFQH